MTVRTPSYRHHRPTGQAVVTIGGRDRYLGKHGSPESQAEYDRLVGEWLANGRRPPDDPAGTDPSVSEVVLAFYRHAEAYYRKGGEMTGEVGNIRLALRPLRKLYGSTAAKDFGPLALKTVRQAMIDADLCRNEVNRRTRIIVRAFRWAAENELVPPSIYHGLKSVTGLRQGRSEARESAPIRPVPDSAIEAARPHMARQVQAMVTLQQLSGMRPGEATQMRGCDLDTTGEVWVYVPGRHKTEHHGKERVIYVGPRAQVLLKPWLRADPDAYLFQPREATAERRAAQRAARKSPVQPSQVDRSKPRPKKRPGARYDARSYCRAVAYACTVAGIKKWHPNQLRHSAATDLRKQFGLDVARIILGHSSAAITETYAEADQAKAMSVMGKVG